VNKCPVCNKDPSPVHPSFTLRAICDSVRALRENPVPLSSSPSKLSDIPPTFETTTTTATTSSTTDNTDSVTAEQEKQLGNEKYGGKKYAEAIQHYSKALAKSPTGDPKNAVIYNNRAQCYIKIEQHRRALDDCDEAIRLDPHDVKAFMRKGLCLYRMGNFAKSREAYNEARQLDTQGKWKDAIDEALLSLPNTAQPSAQPLPTTASQFYSVPQAGNYAPYPYPPPMQQRYTGYPGQYQYYPAQNPSTTQASTTTTSTSNTSSQPGRAPASTFAYPPYGTTTSSTSTTSSSGSGRRRSSNNPSHPDGCSVQ